MTPDDAKQTSAAEEFIASGAWVSHLVLVEMTWVLASAYELSAVRIATAVEMLLSHEHLSLQDPEVIRRANQHFRQKPSLGFSDCLIL